MSVSSKEKTKSIKNKITNVLVGIVVISFLGLGVLALNNKWTVTQTYTSNEHGFSITFPKGDIETQKEKRNEESHTYPITFYAKETNSSNNDGLYVVAVTEYPLSSDVNNNARKILEAYADNTSAQSGISNFTFTNSDYFQSYPSAKYEYKEFVDNEKEEVYGLIFLKGNDLYLIQTNDLTKDLFDRFVKSFKLLSDE